MSDADQNTLLPAEPKTEAPAPTTPAAFATLIATDGRVMKLDVVSGALHLELTGRREPVIFDRFQTAAFRAAAAALPEG